MPKVGANIYKRKDGRWEARYVKTVLPNGKKKYGSVYAHTYREVRQKQLQCMNSHQLTLKRHLPESFGDLMLAWLISRTNEVKRSSYLKYESLIRNHLSSGIGLLPISQVSSTVIDEFSKAKLSGNTPLSHKTVNDILTIIGLAFVFAEEEYGITPPRIRRVKETHVEMRVLTKTEQVSLEKYLLAKTDMRNLGIYLALYSGVRVGELCALNWDDLDSGVLSVNKTLHRIKQGNKTVLEITSPKTMASIRRIPLPSKVSSILESHRNKGRLIVGSKGLGIEPRTMQYYFKKVLNKCNIPDANFHSLRHTFATRCVELGFDTKTLSEILGHTDVKTTLNKYVHSSFEQKQRNMEKLSALVIDTDGPSKLLSDE